MFKSYRYSLQNTRKIPSIRIKCVNGKINLSGFENLLKREYDITKDISYVSAYTLAVVLKAIQSMLLSFKTDKSIPVLFSGGVMSCKWLQTELSKLCEGYFAQPVFSSDNAAGIALLARYAYSNGEQ